METFITYKDNQKIANLYKKGNWIQKATTSIKKRGTEGVCTGSKFGGPSCPPGSKRYNLAKTFKKMQKNRKHEEGGVITYKQNTMTTNKKPIKKKATAKQNPQIDQQKADQQEFLMWLQQKLGIQDEVQLQSKIQELGEEGLKQAYVQFQQEKQAQQTQAFRSGGMFQHLSNLLSFKKGSKMQKECKGCSNSDTKDAKKKLQMLDIAKQTAEIGTTSATKSPIKKKK